MLRYILLSCFFLFVTVAGFSQQENDDRSRYGQGKDSIRCIENINRFLPYAKVGEFREAAPYWELVYQECPAATKSIYIYGPQILKSMISEEFDSVKRLELVDKLMRVYDDRIKYFGDDQKYPASWILGVKALDYAALAGNGANRNLLFSWYKASVDGLREKTDIRLYVPYLQLTQLLFKQNELSRADFMQIYDRVAQCVDVALKSADRVSADYLQQVKKALPDFLAVSGAADCETLKALYTPQLEKNKKNAAFLKQAIVALRKAECTDSDLYFTLSEYSHQVAPTFESAMGLASRAFNEENTDLAIVRFEEAALLTTDGKEKAEALYNIAVIHASGKNYAVSRRYARQVVEANPGHGKAYLLMANLYAAAAPAIYPSDSILARTVYYAVLDKLEKARQADPMLDGEVLELIVSYRRLLPSADDIFMHPDLEKGKTFTIGGWIQEKTVIR